MKLLSIECASFRQHVETRIAFHSGLTGIVGPNGAGKSTLVEAIAFALFGSRAVRGKLEGVVTRGARRTKTKVILRFEHGGHGFVVERTLNDASLLIGGSREAMVSGNRPVTQRIQEILGLSYEEFIATYYTEQKGLEFLSGQRGATERARFIIKMMGYDRLEKAQELLRKERRDLKNKLSGIEASIADETLLKQRIVEETKSYAVLQAELKESTQATTAAVKQFEKLEGEWKKLEKAQQVFALRQRTLETLDGKLEGAQEVIASRQKQISALQEKLIALQQQVVDWDGEESLVLDALANVQEQRVALDAQLAQLRTDWEEKRVQASTTLRVAQDRINREQAAVEELELLEDKAECPTCGQALGDSYEALLSAGRERCSHASEKLATIQLEEKAAQVAPQQVLEVEQKLRDVQRREITLNETLTTLAQIKLLENEMTQHELEISSRRENFAALQKEQEDLRAQISDSTFSESDFKQKKTAFETARQLLELSRMKRLRQEGETEKSAALLERSKAELQKARGVRMQFEEQKRELLLLDESDAAFTEVRRALNASIRPRLAELSSEFLTDLTDGRYSSLEIGDDFTPTVFEDGEAKPVISGGEQDIVNLCVRLALSQLVAERAGHAISLLMVDEVFGSLDENRRYNVLMLLEKLQNRFDQVLLITHLDDIKEGVHHFINVEYDEGSGEVHIDALDSYEMLAMNL